jgi:hypothetical protein
MSHKGQGNGKDRAAIFARLWETEDGRMPRLLARLVLRLGFRDRDKARMHELAVKNQDGSISPPELEELDDYIEAGDLMALLQSKARAGATHISPFGAVQPPTSP